MKVGIGGIGVWGRGMRSYAEFRELLAAGGDGAMAEWVPPAPEVIPARERRRAPLMVKLAVEVADQACAMAGVDSRTVATVFASSMGDTEITDYMCRTLAGDSKALSPTRFHNSVHNAPAGYWSIAAGNREPSSSTAASRESFPVAFLEAATLSAAESRPVLLVASDIAVPGPLGDVYPIGEPFGVALLLDAAVADDGWTLSVVEADQRQAWPGVQHPLLAAISERNPAARGLALLEAIAVSESAGAGPDAGIAVQWPLNDFACLRIEQAPDQASA